MKNNIQYIIYGVFGVAIVIAILIFALNVDTGSGTGVNVRGNVEIWGTLPAQSVRNYIDRIATNDLKISYRQISETSFDSTITNAWASGNGPDMILADGDTIIRNENKLFHIPYASFPETTYNQTYADIGQVFLLSDGVLAFPLLVDPLVTYYNRDTLASSFTLFPPATWTEILEFAKKNTTQGGSGLVLKSGVALGAYKNITNAKGILSALLMQSGNNIVGEDEAGVKISLLSYDNSFTDLAESALDFYTSFAKPSELNYSWNESLPKDLQAFILGDLAIYFGYASEIDDLRRLNPNLNFDATIFPQFENGAKKITHGKTIALAIGKLSKNIPASIAVASKFSSPEILQDMYTEFLIPPARRNLLGTISGASALETTFFQSAIIARAWYDPDGDITNSSFETAIRNILSGLDLTEDAIARLHADLNQLLR